MSLSQVFIDSIGEIAYQESPELCLTEEKFNVVEAESAKQLKAPADCLPYYRFLHTLSLTAKIFINDSFGEGETTQVNTIYWCCHNFLK